MNAQQLQVPLIIRGRIVKAGDAEFGGRRGDVSFRTADVRSHIGELVLGAPSRMGDLHTLKFEDIVSYLAQLGDRLRLDRNPYLQEAFEMSCLTSGLCESILRHQYETVPEAMQPEVVRELAERTIGIDYLEGWVDQPVVEGRSMRARIRAFGARTVHVIAGNSPWVAMSSILRNAVTRSDAIIKTPSNDPLTAMSLAQTMIEMEPDHPLTRHLSVAYWKGGDEEVESRLYDPRSIEKIVAWGGFASVKHITRYLQPGLDLVTLDPKHSSSLIGAEAFADEATLKSVARRLALDIGAMNQEACASARVIYVVSGTDGPGLARANRLGELTYAALQGLPSRYSTPHKGFDPDLKAELDGVRFLEDDYKVIGGRGSEGAIIVSQSDAPVDFARKLACRVGNIVPVDDVDTAVKSVNAYTQTIGIYPENLKQELRERLAFQGAQRLTSLGAAILPESGALPQDGIELMRRMVKWIVEESGVAEELEAEAIGQAALLSQ